MIQQRENMFTEMNQGWQDAKQQHQHSMMQDKMMMQNMWQQEKQNHEYHMMMQQKMQSDIWKNEEQNYMAEKMVKEFEESQKQDPVKEQENINRAADSMIDIMKQDDSPRFKNSKFLGFLKDIQSQKIKIENDQVVVNEQHQADFFEDAYKEAEQDYKFDQQEFMSMWDKQKEMYANQQQHQQQHFEEQFEAAKEEYEFAQMNEFLAENDPFEQAQQLIDQGKTYEAILALEAGLQKQNNDKAWHLLGRLHQVKSIKSNYFIFNTYLQFDIQCKEMDDDKRALACLLKAHEADQNNLDVLLALGVSCTNNLDEDDAMKFLRRWIENNPKYQLKNLPQENNVENIINIFTQTSNSHNNSDPELLTVLSVLHFIDRDYDQAVHYFKASLKLDPSNYSLWNKLGATLAHLGHADEAMQAYGKALELKPNYVRVWVNLGIAQAYKQNYKEAARLYLNALSFNPKAEHLWNYLQTNFMCMQRFDLSDQTLNRDINAFRSEFKILNIEDLPKPQIDCKNFMLDKKAKNEFLIKQDEWAREFNS